MIVPDDENAKARFDFQPYLVGDIVEMRPVTSSDYAALFALGSDPAVWDQHPNRDRYLESPFRDYFTEGLASGCALVARRRADGAVIGWSRYSTAFAGADEIEIGWSFLGRAYWGGRYNGDMKRIMIAHAFRFVSHVIFRIGEQNARSRAAVERLGAVLLDRKEVKGANGTFAVTVYYGLARSNRSG
jgi:RimJ/RimL family protein N-acetyltransferase